MENQLFINIMNSQSILAGQFKIQKQEARDEYNRLVRLKLQEKRILNLTDKHKKKYHYIAPYFSRNENIN